MSTYNAEIVFECGIMRRVTKIGDISIMAKKDEEFIRKFKYVMHEMFSETNQDFTFNNFDKYVDNPKLKEIGLYVVRVKDGCKIELVSDLDNPEGPKFYKKYDKKKKEDVIKELKKFKYDNTMPEFQAKLVSSDDEFLYIGKATGNDKIQGRLKKYKKFGNSVNIKQHSGGRRIWFIKNNKNNLVIDAINIISLEKNFSKIYSAASTLKKQPEFSKKGQTELLEAALIYLHSFAYGGLPFANEEFECTDTEEFWYEFWKNDFKID